jgi:cyclopropane fatty-acyl-phospholipid synthase-like methyltransferase
MSMTAAEFEALYRTDPDPWRYETSAYEREKYAATLAACVEPPFEAALELGSSIGVFTEMLAPLCVRLDGVDFSPTATRLARRRLESHPGVRLIVGSIPEAIPEGPYDLVVASEVLYYLDGDALEGTVAALEQRIPIGGRVVCVHWRRPGRERPFTAAAVHERVAEVPWLRSVSSGPTEKYLLDAFERR